MCVFGATIKGQLKDGGFKNDCGFKNDGFLWICLPSGKMIYTPVN